MFVPCSLGTRILQPPRQGRHNGPSHHVLDSKHVLAFARITFGQQLTTRSRLGKPGGDADLVANPAHASVDDILDPELPPDFTEIDKLYAERGVPPYDDQGPEPRQ